MEGFNSFLKRCQTYRRSNLTVLVSVSESVSKTKHYVLSGHSTENEITPALQNKYKNMQADDLHVSKIVQARYVQTRTRHRNDE